MSESVSSAKKYLSNKISEGGKICLSSDKHLYLEMMYSRREILVLLCHFAAASFGGKILER